MSQTENTKDAAVFKELKGDYKRQRFEKNVNTVMIKQLPLYLRVPSKRVAMVSRKVFCGARRPFITGIVTQMWDGQRLVVGHTIPEVSLVVSRGSQQLQYRTVRVTVQS